MAPSSNPPPFDTIWLGVHKTGTTFLQKCLDLSQPALRAHGVHYFDLAEFRRLYTRPLLHLNHPDPPAPPLSRDARHRLVFDENILALVQHALGDAALYPDAANRATSVANHLGLTKPRVVLGLRSFRTFLPSLYGEALKSTPFRPFRAFNVTHATHLSWNNLITRLIAAFPGSPVLCYAAEDLRGHERDLLTQIADLPPDAVSLITGSERPGFSDAAVRALHDLAEQRPVTRDDVSAQARQFPRLAGVAAYNPWTDAEAIALDQRYTADLASIRRRPEVQFINLASRAL
ncbi:MAG: hypothetical protein ABI832_14530 [bacterium]